MALKKQNVKFLSPVNDIILCLLISLQIVLILCLIDLTFFSWQTHWH